MFKIVIWLNILSNFSNLTRLGGHWLLSWTDMTQETNDGDGYGVRFFLCIYLDLHKMLEQGKTCSPKWRWINGNLPWYKVKHHVKQSKLTSGFDSDYEPWYQLCWKMLVHNPRRESTNEFVSDLPRIERYIFLVLSSLVNLQCCTKRSVSFWTKTSHWILVV